MAISKQVLENLGRYRVAAQAHKDVLARYNAFSEIYPYGSTVPDSARPELAKLISDHEKSDRDLDHAARLLAHYFSEDCGF